MPKYLIYICTTAVYTKWIIKLKMFGPIQQESIIYYSAFYKLIS